MYLSWKSNKKCGTGRRTGPARRKEKLHNDHYYTIIYTFEKLQKIMLDIHAKFYNKKEGWFYPTLLAYFKG